MRYKILRPSRPIDPRFIEIDSLEALYRVAPVASEGDLEQDAVDYVREVHPDAMAMPFQIKIGSGHIMLMGIIEADVDYDPDGRGSIPFLMFVYAVPDNGRDRYLIKQQDQYHRDLWKPPLLRPGAAPYVIHRVSVRATDFEVYPATDAQVFERNGKLVLFVSVGDTDMSIEFVDGDVDLVAKQSRSITSG